MAPSVSLRVRELLKARGMSASQLSRRADLSWPTVQALTSGKEKDWQLSTLEKIAAALGVPVSELLVDDEVGVDRGS